MTEEWRPVVGYEGAYEVSTEGRVRSLPRITQRRDGRPVPVAGRVLSASRNKAGHYRVWLTVNGAGSSRTVHRLVLEAFVGPPPQGMEACHKDDNKADNSLSNLRWDSRFENARDRVRNGIHHVSSRTHCANGHAYETSVTPGNWRRCKTCNRDRTRQYRARKAAA